MLARVEQVKNTVSAWAGITVNPHRFGGLEFNLGTVEVGHIHSDGMVDIPFNSKIRTQLLAERKAEPHHLLPETGWITYYIRSAGDVEQAIWLFRLSYLFNATRGAQKAALKDAVNVPEAFAALQPSAELQAIFGSVARITAVEEQA
ncbi:MAG: DUF5519 family protein [Chloroflexi bacterium]|nr:DUF5519 family protein [Chloroflexota bacterium]